MKKKIINKFEYKPESKALHIHDVSGITVLEIGSLVRVYSNFFSKKAPNDVNRDFYRDILVDEVESVLSTNYCIVFRGVDINNKNSNTNRSDFNISKSLTNLRFIEKLENRQLKVAM